MIDSPREVYLDFNATTPLHPMVRERMVEAMDACGNPSSLHSYGRQCRRLVEESRSRVAEYLRVDPGEIFFTSGGTESNNLFVAGDPEERSLWVGAGEHPSVLEPARRLWGQGRDGGMLPHGSDGRVQAPESLPEEAWISVQWANSETGVCNEIPTLIERFEQAGIDREESVIHCDGAQGFFRLPERISDLGVDVATLTAHKSFGPTGVGVLYVKRGVVLEASQYGGSQERRLRPGTESIVPIVAMGALCELAEAEELWPREQLERQRQALRENLIDTSIVPLTPAAGPLLPNTLLVSVPGFDGELLVAHLERRGYAVGTGTACSSGGKIPSTHLHSMGCDDATIRGALRLSWGPSTTDAELEGCAAALRDVLAELRS